MAYPPQTVSGKVTSFIPFTTSYSPPASCSTLYRWEDRLVAFDPAYGQVDTQAVNCQPAEVTSWWQNTGQPALSLGPLNCPNGWQTAVTALVGPSSTQIMCCPNQYSLEDGIPNSAVGNCYSPVSQGQVLTFASTPFGSPNAWTTKTTTLSYASSVGAIAIVGWQIPMQASATGGQLGTITGQTGTTGSTPAPSSTASSPSSSVSQTFTLASSASKSSALASGGSQTSGISSQSPESTGSPPTSNLSTGAWAGIGTGIGVSFLGFVTALIGTCYVMRRKKADERPGEERAAEASPGAQLQQGPQNNWTEPVYAQQMKHAPFEPHELAQPERYELAGDEYRNEMDAIRSPVEADSEPPRRSRWY